MSPLPRSLLPERIRAAVRSARRQAFEWIGSDRYSRFGLDGLDMRLDRAMGLKPIFDSWGRREGVKAADFLGSGVVQAQNVVPRGE